MQRGLNQQSLLWPGLFFTVHLCHQKRVSPQTIASCRDTFRLLLTFVRETVGIEPSALCIPDLDAPTILAFLDHLEHRRGNAVRSRNIRLSALRTFFRFVALRDPENVTIATRVLAIPRKREDKKLIGYLTRDEMEALLAAPDRSHWVGRRDHALLLTTYNSGARVSEITALRRAQVYFGATTFLNLHGKGARNAPSHCGRRPVGSCKHGFGRGMRWRSRSPFPTPAGNRCHGMGSCISSSRSSTSPPRHALACAPRPSRPL